MAEQTFTPGQPIRVAPPSADGVARRALILLDGLDEGGQKREEIERHATEVLAPQGHVLLCTSRPQGVDKARFAAFRRLELAPLTEAQQKQALEQRLGADRAEALLQYVSTSVLRDEKGARVTANPLMLSVVASVFELRAGIDMPATITELYSIATDAMLARGGRDASPALRRLLQRATAHVRALRWARQLDLVHVLHLTYCKKELTRRERTPTREEPCRNLPLDPRVCSPREVIRPRLDGDR